MSTAEPVLSVRDLDVEFGSEAGRVHAVRGVSFDLAAGSATAIVGESGSGKSVTALGVLGLLPDTARMSGSVRLRGRELIGLDDVAMSKVRGNEIAMIFQDPLSSLTPVFTVGDQIAEAVLAHQDLPKRRAAERAVELLDLVGIPDPSRRARAYPHELSGGMRQRVMIAMAIANNPKVIIADEPTTALDVTIQAQILEVLGQARRETGAALLLITHDLGMVAGTADDVVVMYAGRTVEKSGVDALFRTPRMPYTIGLLGAVPRVDRRTDALTPIPGTPPLLIDLPDACPFAPRCPIVGDECRKREPALESVADAHVAACLRSGEIGDDQTIDGSPVFAPDTQNPVDDAPVPVDSPHAPGSRPVVLRVRGLRKEFPLTGGLLRRRVGTVRAVTGVSFDLHAGETLAIVGESGSGKSTTLRELMDFTQPEGVVGVDGTDPATMSKRSARVLRRRMSMVFQDPASALDPRFTAFDIIAEPLRALGMSRSEVGERVAGLMRRVGLDPAHADRYPIAFSGGQRQRIAIARALITDPALVILDEPLSSLDVSVQADIVNLIARLQRDSEIAYLLVAHDLSVVRHAADRVAVMYLGGFVEVGTAEQIFDAPTHPYTRALLSAVPVPDPVVERDRRPILLTGEQPSPTAEYAGCSFAGRCPLYAELDEEHRNRCRTEVPGLRVVATATPSHEAACHHFEKVLSPIQEVAR
ncbi:ABC transporter ATP-binding protein [Gordonia rhizosphera]|uniref:Putative ABC transporter ATP-binding protein n=1 Tax=Gordonia rhizosphera NBRC 16068 TaxID=1108045 RepID=K6VZY4_9ACTN|nr:ABC transporter ATP-binding protein [Gordonia rhizosphera]GAB92475.1 putative ABC transporter ATP-binding protein [Gordonia rhizosphera NBRC 16068]